MNKMNKILLSVSALTLALTVASCSDADYKPLDNSIYINGATSDPLRTLTVGESEVSTDLFVRLASPARQETKIQLAVEASELDAYNKRYDDNYELLPAEYYTLSATELTVAAGRASAEVKITVKPFSTELKESGKRYAVPVTVKGATGTDAAALGNAKTFVIGVDQVVEGKAIKLELTQGLRALRPEPVVSNTWTVEMRVKSDNIQPRYNNQSFLGIGAAEGGEAAGYIFGRWEGENLQFKINGHDGINATIKPESDKWYHVAIVCDNGTVRLYVNGQPSGEFQNAKFATMARYQNFVFAYPRDNNHTYRRSNYYMSEVRFWNVVRSAKQIRNNRFQIDPKTPGLVAYWKLDEGAGTTFKDATGGGLDLQLYSTDNNLTSHWVNISSAQD